MKIKIIDFGGRVPVRAHYNDAGADVYSPKNYVIQPGCVVKVPLGFGLELPDGMVGFIFPRSGLSAKGIVCELPPIDSGYRGEVYAIISNVSHDCYSIKAGDRIGQLVIFPVMTPDFVMTLENAERGAGAFGSTGV
ncbi:MAG: dUTP diphosphatase [Ruminococcus sp.]|nr:dUTP diphosphatase [Ruminococcus sp.]